MVDTGSACNSAAYNDSRLITRTYNFQPTRRSIHKMRALVIHLYLLQGRSFFIMNSIVKKRGISLFFKLPPERSSTQQEISISDKKKKKKPLFRSVNFYDGINNFDHYLQHR